MQSPVESQLKRLLGILGFHRPDDLHLTNDVDKIRAITWLEDRKIRLMEVEEREPLRIPGALWNTVAAKV